MSAKFFSRRLGMLSLAIAAVCLAALLGGNASAALLSYEPFLVGTDPSAGEYLIGRTNSGGQTGASLGGQNPTNGPTPFYAGGWGGGDSGNQVVGNQGENSLKYPELLTAGKLQREGPPQFSCCTFGRSGRELLNPLGLDAGSSTLYNSFLIDFGDQGTDDHADGNRGKQGYEMWLGGIGDGNLSIDFYFNGYSGDDLLTLKSRGFNPFEDPLDPGDDFVEQKAVVGAGYSRDDLALINGGTQFAVLKFEFNEGNPDPNASLADPSDDDIVTVYLNPTSSNEGDWTPALVLNSPLSNLIITHHSAFSHFTFSGGGHNGGAIDEIRFGETFADVTPFIPEPASLTLAGLSLAGLLLSRRRK